MDPVTLGSLAVGLVGLAAAASSVRARRRLARVWLEAAREAGLEGARIRSIAGWPRRIEARRGGLRIVLDARHEQGAEHAITRVRITGLTKAIGLRPASAAVLNGRPAHRDFQTGDHEFDRLIACTGDRATGMALLSQPVRSIANGLIGARMIGRNGVVVERPSQLVDGTLETSRVVGDQPEWIAAFLRDMLALAEGLSSVTSVEEALQANARQDILPDVRRANLRCLLDGFPEWPGTREVLELALKDRDEQVQIDAAVELGAEARPTLHEIATSEWSSDASAARAIGELRSFFSAEDARATLALALRVGRHAAAEACLESLGHRGAAQAGVIEDALARSDGAVAFAAARALGRVGASAAIMALLEAEQRLSGDQSFRAVSREAVAAIQSRLVGAGQGQVSLADAEPGRVSLADDLSGRVSLPSEKTPHE